MVLTNALFATDLDSPVQQWLEDIYKDIRFGENTMINGILYMETRIFSEFCRRKSMSAKDANQLFNMYDIWGFIETCYEILSMGSDELVLEDIEKIMNRSDTLIES